VREPLPIAGTFSGLFYRERIFLLNRDGQAITVEE
jgi:hypothetical protein